MITIGLVVVLAVILYILTKRRKNSVSLEEVMSDLKKGALLIDVRSSAEFRSGHAKGAKNIPLDDIQRGILPTKNKDTIIYVYCHSGARASAARSLLGRGGFGQVVNLGGLARWRSMGGEIKSN